MVSYGKVIEAKEEHKIAQYKEEINLIITEEIAERKIQDKEELMIKSLHTKIREKEWVKEVYKLNDYQEDQGEVFETSTHLLVESIDEYEILIKVDNINNIAEIINTKKRTGETYLVTYHPNGGIGKEEQVEVKSGFSIALKECNYNKEGYNFGGWSEEAEGNGTRYLPNTSYKPDKNITLYATWEADMVTINFNSNDENAKTQKLEIIKGKDTKLPKNTFKRDGYIFVEWNTEQDGSGQSYQENGNIKISEDTILYAIWKEITTVTKDNYGWLTNYKSSGWNGQWRVFYQDTNNVYLITDTCVETNYVPSEHYSTTKPTSNPNWDNYIYKTITFNSNYSSHKASAYLMTGSNWAKYKDSEGNASWAIGGVPGEMYIDSLNQAQEKDYGLVPSTKGYMNNKPVNGILHSWNHGIYYNGSEGTLLIVPIDINTGRMSIVFGQESEASLIARDVTSEVMLRPLVCIPKNKFTYTITDE